METRALAIAFFYAIGTGAGGIIGPLLFGKLTATGVAADTALGFLIGAGLMIAAGVVEVFLGVDAEQKSLEQIATPMTAEQEATEPKRRVGRDVRAGWAPQPSRSTYPSHERPELYREIDRILAAFAEEKALTREELYRRVAARRWGPGRFGGALRAAVAEGAIERVGRNVFRSKREPERTH
jgi:hypothetical protein